MTESRAGSPPAGAEPANPATSFLRPKGELTRNVKIALAVIALLPIASIALRVLSLPGVMGFELGPLRAISVALNQALSLSTIPADQRNAVLYLLFLPTCALLVALARLTLGIRVLGYRSILIAVGFHQSGVIPSLILIGVAVATIVLLRPWLRRIKLPYYGRVSVILCIVAMTMVGALLADPFIRSDVLWGVAYFPVIVLAMLAEGIASTLDKNNAVSASWSAITTILLAFVIAIVCWTPALRTLMLQFPELVLPQIVAIILVSEYLDLRLLHGWDARVARRLMPRHARIGDKVPIAVVRNRIDGEGAARPGERPPALRSVQKIVDALREEGHPICVLEGDASLPGELRKFFPPVAKGEPFIGLVLNLAHGTRGGAGATQVPAVLDLMGVAYTGPGPLGHATLVDRAAARSLVARAGVPVPAFGLMAGPKDDVPDLDYPALVHPRHEPGVKPRVVRDRRELRRAVRRVVRRYRQEAFVEERPRGRRVRAGLIGNSEVECLPLVDLSSRGAGRMCPAKLGPELEERVRAHAVKAFHACGCRDYARVDVSICAAGETRVIEVSTLGILAGSGSFALAAAEAGYDFRKLLARIVEVARERYLVGEPVRPAGARRLVPVTRHDVPPEAEGPARALPRAGDQSPPIGLTSSIARE